MFAATMKPRTSQDSNRTALASEYHVLSLLHRKRINAHLTLGSYKAVDIVIIRDKGDIKTIDVKGASFVDFRVGGKSKPRSNHYYAFVAYDKHFEDTAHLPEVFILPSVKLGALLHKYANLSVVRLQDLRNSSYLFANNWKVLK
jgi:hypothetical protein